MKKKSVKIDVDLILLGERIKALRIKAGYSSYEIFAYDIGIHRVQVGRYEKGQNLNYLTLLKLVRAFDMTLEEFFSEGFDSLEK